MSKLFLVNIEEQNRDGQDDPEYVYIKIPQEFEQIIGEVCLCAEGINNPEFAAVFFGRRSNPDLFFARDNGDHENPVMEWIEPDHCDAYINPRELWYDLRPRPGSEDTKSAPIAIESIKNYNQLVEQIPVRYIEKLSNGFSEEKACTMNSFNGQLSIGRPEHYSLSANRWHGYIVDEKNNEYPVFQQDGLDGDNNLFVRPGSFMDMIESIREKEDSRQSM